LRGGRGLGGGVPLTHLNARVHLFGSVTVLASRNAECRLRATLGERVVLALHLGATATVGGG
jgi:hypothetical protein